MKKAVCGVACLILLVLEFKSFFPKVPRKQIMDSKSLNLLKFPCEFIIKVFGNSTDEFETTVISIVKNHILDLRENSFTTRLSKDEKYLAITITVNVNSREQLDNLYRELSASPLVLLAL